MSRREKQPSRADAEPRTTRQKVRRAAAGDGARGDDDQGLGNPSARDGESPQPAAEDSAMNYDAQVQPRRMSTRSAQARAAAGPGTTTRSRLQIDARSGPERFNGEQMPLGSTQALQYQRRYQSEASGFPARSEQEWQDVDPQSPAFTRVLQGTTPRNVEEDKTDTSRDPSTDNGDSSGNNSLEPQQWSEAQEGNNRPSSAGDLGRENQGDVQCRVSWCEHVGQRYGLCWAHGGVKKCCHRNCPKIALATGEFCSLHEREVSANSF